jgi:tetratricopeptide (TPR) repeat protein
MNRFAARWFLLIFPCFFAANASAQTPTARIEDTASRSAEKSARVAPVPQQLFGTLPLSTRSVEARKFIELAWDKYENAMYDDAVINAHHATEKDPQSALSYAMLSFVARRSTPILSALDKAKSLLPRSTPDEQLLVRWMTSIQDRDLLPAIMNMNDLLKRFPDDKHILYLTGEWLYLQQDYDHAQSVMETALKIDPNFPAVLNRLGYLYAEAGDPAKAISFLKRYAQVQTSSPNPQDSLGEVLRTTGDDRGSLEHYRASLQIDPTFLASQTGLGDTSTLMGDFAGARQEYDRAIKMASNPRDVLYNKSQKALVYFWEGNALEGRKELAALSQLSIDKKEPNSQTELALARAMLSADPQDELAQIATLAAFLEQTHPGMSEADRSIYRATVLREQVRVGSANGHSDLADSAVSKLESLATSSRDLVIQNIYESAQGFSLFQKGDLANAAEQLGADSRSPLALQQLAITQEKLGNPDAAQAARNRLKYQRGPTVEWFLANHPNSGASH